MAAGAVVACPIVLFWCELYAACRIGSKAHFYCCRQKLWGKRRSQTMTLDAKAFLWSNRPSQQLPDADTASQRFQVAVASSSIDPVSVVSPWHAYVSALLAHFLCNTYYVANLCGSLCQNTTSLSHSTTISSTDSYVSLLAVLKRWDSVVSWDGWFAIEVKFQSTSMFVRHTIQCTCWNVVKSHSAQDCQILILHHHKHHTCQLCLVPRHG